MSEQEKIMTDKSLMPFGKYKNQPLIAVPPWYLLYILENFDLKGPLKAYIVYNKEALIIEKKREELRELKNGRR